ncbi:nuf2 family domain-containing protein [Ditylenchus destructor]|nr:nuf2 family domain-containing protein [Ditylenchus destructor]
MAETKLILDFFQSEAPNLGVTSEMIKTPTADNLIRVYYFLCDLIFNIEERDIYNPKDEVYGRSMMIIRIFDFLSGLFNDILADDTDFHYTDLLLPDPKKTRYFLVQLIQFYRFKCDRQQELDQVANELEERKRDVENEKAFEANTQSALEREREAMEVVRKKKEELMIERSQLDKELARLKGMSDDNKREFEHKNIRDQNLQSKLNEIQLAVREAEDKAKRLDMNIVSSPDRIVGDIEKMEKELSDISKQHQNTTQLIRRLERDLGSQSIAKKIVDRFVGELKQLEIIQDEMTTNRRQEDEKSQSLKEVEQQVRQCEQALAELKSEHETRLRGLQDVRHNNERKIALLAQEKQQLEDDLKELASRNRKAKEEMRAAQQNLKKKEKAISQMGDKFKEALRNLEDRHSQIEDRVKEEEYVVTSIMDSAMKVLRMP